MTRRSPVIRELSWPMVVPQALALGLSIGIAYWFARDSSALMWGAIAYLLYSYGSRYLVLRDHTAGIKATQAGDHARAIRHFQASYRFFSTYSWVDRWRPVLLMSASGASYREMALVNVGFCQAQLGQREQARESYARAATEFPGSPIATAALNLLGPSVEQ